MLNCRFLSESLTLSLVVGVLSLLFLASQMQREHSMEDLLIFLMLFLTRILLKPSSLRQHKTDVEQDPVPPTSTAKSSTDYPLDSIVVFKAKYLLILVPCHGSMFSSQGYDQIPSVS